jgi:hypothetical protein
VRGDLFGSVFLLQLASCQVFAKKEKEGKLRGDAQKQPRALCNDQHKFVLFSIDNFVDGIGETKIRGDSLPNDLLTFVIVRERISHFSIPSKLKVSPFCLRGISFPVYIIVRMLFVYSTVPCSHKIYGS